MQQLTHTTMNEGIPKQLRSITEFPEAMKKGQAAQQLVARAFPRKTVTVKGVEIKLYSISWLAKISGKSPKTICAWERKGMFPKPLLNAKDDYRWYTAAELEGYSKLIKAANLRRGRYLGEVKQTDWLKNNSFAFKARLKEMIEHQIGDFPVRHKSEDDFLRNLGKNNRLKFSPEQVRALIKQ